MSEYNSKYTGKQLDEYLTEAHSLDRRVADLEQRLEAAESMLTEGMTALGSLTAVVKGITIKEKIDDLNYADMCGLWRVRGYGFLLVTEHNALIQQFYFGATNPGDDWSYTGDAFVYGRSTEGGEEWSTWYQIAG